MRWMSVIKTRYFPGMGLIRKSLMVSSGGIVRGSSKKQRVAKGTQRAVQASATSDALTARAASASAAAARASSEVLQRAEAESARRAADEDQFRYDTDPVWRAWVDEKLAKEAAEQLERQRIFDENNALLVVKQQQAIMAKVEAKAAKRSKRRPGSLPTGAGPGQYRFNPPPNWPAPPENFVPVAEWEPDRAWGPPPDGWLVWVPESS